MSAAHSPVNTSSNTNNSFSAIRTHTKRYSIESPQVLKRGETLRDSPRSQARDLLVGLEERKRRLAMETAPVARTNSHSPPSQRPGMTHRQDEQLTPDSRAAKLAAISNVNGSPRTQLPSFTNLTSGVAPEERHSEDDGESQGKRRRIEGMDGSRPTTRESGRGFSSPHQEHEDEEERLYRRELRQQEIRRSNGQQISPRHDRELSEGHGTMSAPQVHNAHSTDARHSSLIEDGYDSNVPLARRRGDVAQAKAGRLHIDTGSVDAGVTGGGSGLGGGYESNLARFKTISSSNIGAMAKSAPPYKMNFSDRDRDGSQFDPRGEHSSSSSSNAQQPSRTYLNGSGSTSQAYHPSNAYATRREIPSQEMHSFNDANSTASNRRMDQYAPTTSSSHHQQQGAIAHRQIGGTPTANTPLSAVRGNIFVPQTATLPSPAYHTTQFVRNPMGGNGNGVVHASQGITGGDSRGINTSSTSHAAGISNLAGPPKTAGLNPPMTARLPEHLRSPPSSKTQFLSLFSNFYDSLTDSRTLKATLEDQVRRSNTLLQTLQKSSRVLELTVDRRVREERILWESKVKSLEERCNRLEKKLGGVEGEDEAAVDKMAEASASTSASVRAPASMTGSIEAGEASSRESQPSTKRSLKEENDERPSQNGSIKGSASINGSEPRDETMTEAE